MTPEEFNTMQIATGKLRSEHITELVKYWQKNHGLIDDGKAGQLTVALLAQIVTMQGTTTVPGLEFDIPTRRCWPLPSLPDGRNPEVTSPHYTKDPSRPTHYGADVMYPYIVGVDPPIPIADGGRSKRHWIPPRTWAIAQADGEVIIAGSSRTGYRLWIRHEGGLQTGGFHFTELAVYKGDAVKMGQALAIVGDNPIDNDPDHLHTELYHGDLANYATSRPPPGSLDPELFWQGAIVLS